ncbi:amphi-Trp domain-containing protein [Halorubrum sp. 48-1-W]|uniref:amphi-Trp domain-containing protein n=1 Tax=Halorubrum sp. 48-1-W TaxID=2249761 RepID=UPI001F5479FC|nr:amphi-Trp domain-containing protein [Halorubrum sp. 48-1-W]
MPEEVLFESESRRSREEIASYLRTVADSLDAGNAITLTRGDFSHDYSRGLPSLRVRPTSSGEFAGSISPFVPLSTTCVSG